MAEQRAIAIEDLKKINVLNEPQLAPDASSIAYIRQYITEEDEYTSHLFVQSVVEKKPIQWTFGKGKAASPRFSPDGKYLVYVGTKEEKAKPQLYLFSLNGGEARAITNFENGASNPIWSPNGQQILFTTAFKEDEIPDKINNQKDSKNETRQAPYVTERLDYKSDAAGLSDGKRNQLAIYDLETEETTFLTSDDFDYAPCAWSPDGEKLVYAANKQGDDKYISDLYILDIASKHSQLLTDNNGVYHGASFSPDGSRIAFYGHEKEFLGATHNELWLLDLNTQERTSLTKNWDVHLTDAAIGDIRSGHATPGPVWSKNEDKLYVTAATQGNTNLYAVDLSGNVEEIFTGSHHIYGYDINVQEDVAVLGVSTPTNPGDAHFIHLTTKEVVQLTFVNEAWTKEVNIQKPEEIRFTAKDGWEIHGWILKPLNYEEGKKYPGILEIHGGPHAMYANTFFHELQLLAAKGYFVFYANPRGSHGYGQEFVNACRGDYGGMDYEDLMSFTDAVIEKYPDLDVNNLGVTGGSYGGFMTNWIVSHTSRFKTAATLRSISNWISFNGVSDIGHFFTEWEIGTDVLKDTEKLWNHSPLKYVNDIETPLLILHSERDYRCPIEQAEQLFIALKLQGKETRFVRFPNSNHELSRSGQPYLRIARLRELTDWFNKYLKD